MKVELKLKKRHPANRMRLGRHVITNAFQLFELNKQEQAELEGQCGQVWFEKMKCEFIKNAKDFDEKPKRKKEKSEVKEEKN